MGETAIRHEEWVLNSLKVKKKQCNLATVDPPSVPKLQEMSHQVHADQKGLF